MQENAQLSFKSVLMSYQEEAVKWCAEHESSCCILAYDMGLGKTVVACGLLANKPEKTVIMVPASLIDQWQSEIHKHTAGMKVAIYHGPKRKTKASRQAVQEADVVLTTTAIMANDIKNGYCISGKRWIIDEAHKLRNKNSINYKYIHSRAHLIKDKVFLTGTPICNASSDLISLLCLSNMPKYSEQNTWKESENSVKIAMLKKIMPDILLRKTKEDIECSIKLPDMTEETHMLKVTDNAQKVCYNHFTGDQAMLRRILRMRQSLNSHTQLIEQLKQEENISQNETGNIYFMESVECIEFIESVKIKKTFEILAAVPVDEKVIIFSYFTQFLLQMSEMLEKKQYKVALYHGQLERSVRTEILTDFKTNPDTRILLINLRAGGVGLNLVEANHVILMEPYWNDAEQLQAINRVYRIGQTRPVKVHKLVVKTSIETWLQSLQKSKTNLSKYLIDRKHTKDSKDSQCSEDSQDCEAAEKLHADELILQRNTVKQLFRQLKDVTIPESKEEEKAVEEVICAYVLA